MKASQLTFVQPHRLHICTDFGANVGHAPRQNLIPQADSAPVFSVQLSRCYYYKSRRCFTAESPRIVLADFACRLYLAFAFGVCCTELFWTAPWSVARVCQDRKYTLFLHADGSSRESQNGLLRVSLLYSARTPRLAADRLSSAQVLLYTAPYAVAGAFSPHYHAVTPASNFASRPLKSTLCLLASPILCCACSFGSWFPHV